MNGDGPICTELRYKVIGGLLVRVVVDDYFCSIGDGPLGHGLSDAFGTSGDDEDLANKRHCVDCGFCCCVSDDSVTAMFNLFLLVSETLVDCERRSPFI